jgi:hypothetical protein
MSFYWQLYNLLEGVIELLFLRHGVCVVSEGAAEKTSSLCPLQSCEFTRSAEFCARPELQEFRISQLRSYTKLQINMVNKKVFVYVVGSDH